MNEELTEACILACRNCASECEQTALACSLSPKVNTLAKCLEMAIYCADMCRLTIAFTLRSELHAGRFTALCAEVCDICAAECEKYTDAACRRCAQACRECAQACRKISTIIIPERVENSTILRESA